MTDDTQRSDATSEEQSDDQESGTDAPAEMTEQIEASFGPMSVYVSGTDTEEVRKTFEDVWETMMDTSEKMREMRDDDPDPTNEPSGRTFGD